MKKVLLTALFSVLFVSMISAQEAVVSEGVKTEKSCCKTKKKSECPQAKKAECKAKKAECKAKKTACKSASKAQCKGKAAKGASCKPGCTKPCCASKTKKTASVDGYACPMKCEKDKVYKKDGACPVCKMDLKNA